MTTRTRVGLPLGVLLGLVGTLVVADTLTLPHVFTPNTPARAVEVNDNFTAIRDLLNGNLDGGNIQDGTIGPLDIADESLSPQELASNSVGSSELQDFVILGAPGSGGSAIATNPAGIGKSTLSFSTEQGGYVDVRNEANPGIAIQLSTPAGFGDGGLLSVFTGGGSIAVQLQPDGDVAKIGNNGFVHPHPSDPSKQIIYMSLEGGERGTYCRGEARLVEGRCTVTPPEHWQLVTSTQGITVQLTAAGPSTGLFVEELTREALVVRETGQGRSNARFYYQINGVRAGFEDHEVIEQNTMFLPQRDSVSGDDVPEGVRAAMISNGLLFPDGTRNAVLVERLREEAFHAQGAQRVLPQPAPSVEPR